MGWITERLGNGFWGTVDGDNPDAPPQVTLASGSIEIGKVDQGKSGTDPWQVVIVAGLPQTVNNLIATPASTSEVLLLSGHYPRVNLIIYNQSKNNLWVKYNSGVTSSFFNFKVPPHGIWESSVYAWSGDVYGIWDGTDGQALVSEQY